MKLEKLYSKRVSGVLRGTLFQIISIISAANKAVAWYALYSKWVRTSWIFETISESIQLQKAGLQEQKLEQIIMQNPKPYLVKIAWMKIQWNMTTMLFLSFLF